MTQQHILIISAGSIGKRHIRNFATLGCQVSVMDPRSDRLAEAAAAAPVVHQFTDFADALAEATRFSGIVIGSPTKFHVEQAVAALEAGLPVYLEKPMSIDAASATQLMRTAQKTATPLLLGYTYRWWPPLHDLKMRLQHAVVGKVLHVHCTMSAHLADWHPWERYQDFFMASKELGGGALLDESHFLDLILWLWGRPAQIFGKIERLSSLEIDSDDNVDVWLSYANGMRVLLHLDLFGRPHDRSFTIRGETGTLVWTTDPNQLRLSAAAQGEWQETNYTCERNTMFADAAQEFLQVINGEKAPSCTVEDGFAVMQLVEAVRKSSATGQAISL